MAAPGPGAEPGRLVAQALSAGDPTGWFEPLYAAAEEGAAGASGETKEAKPKKKGKKKKDDMGDMKKEDAK